tara:strand:+ start:453 stop:662 length:210 start_codon:yes stop_codon:yes gene_type:complete
VTLGLRALSTKYQKNDIGITKMKTTDRIKVESYYCYCPHCETIITDLREDSYKLQKCPNWECKKEFWIK